MPQYYASLNEVVNINNNDSNFLASLNSIPTCAYFVLLLKSIANPHLSVSHVPKKTSHKYINYYKYYYNNYDFYTNLVICSKHNATRESTQIATIKRFR